MGRSFGEAMEEDVRDDAPAAVSALKKRVWGLLSICGEPEGSNGKPLARLSRRSSSVHESRH
jgi:hypothetical protein